MNPYKVGDQLVCVYPNHHPTRRALTPREDLTEGEVYEVIGISYDDVILRGIRSSVNHNRMAPVSGTIELELEWGM